jgi:glutamate formiminotransferase
MMKIIEIVPNYSEGRNPLIMDQIVAPFLNQVGIHLTRLEMDANYNRSVLTVIGEAETVMTQMVASAVIASQLIDLRIHTGEHPRMGAVDVCPLIPIANVTEEECIAYSKRLAEAMHKATGVPIYLYSKSSTRENCVNLPDIRRGEFEGMSAKMKDPKWYPDFGPNSPHPSAGVTAVGVRPPLVAFNIDVNTKNKKAVLEIARKIRYSGGGYRFIQANPAYLNDKGFCHVTMNLTDYTQTALYQAIEAVKMEAKRYNIEMTGSEIVGLVSRECLADSLKYYLHIDDKEELHLSLDEITRLSIQYFGLRDFSKEKIIEFYTEAQNSAIK